MIIFSFFFLLKDSSSSGKSSSSDSDSDSSGDEHKQRKNKVGVVNSLKWRDDIPVLIYYCVWSRGLDPLVELL